MVSAKRWGAALLVVALLLTGSVAAWLFLSHQPPKNPVRARQVMAAGYDSAVVRPPQRINTPRPAHTKERTAQSNHKEEE